jgi:cytochrome P450
VIPRNPFARAVRYRDGLPVLPGAFPLVGHLPAFYRDAPAVLRAAHAELGPLFWLAAGPEWVVSYTGREALDVFKNKSFTSSHLQKLSPLVAGRSLLSQDGDAHRRMRAAMNAPFVPRGLSAGVVGPMTASAISARVAAWVNTGRVEILQETREVALEIIFRMIGIVPGDLPSWRAQYRELVLANLQIPVMLPGFPAYRAARAQRWINARFLEIIEAVRRSGDTGTVVGALVHAKDDEGRAMSDAELTDNLRLLVLGGHETMASTMAWLVITLAGEPRLWDALCEEARGAPAVPTSPEAARALLFAEALFRETVRMHPAFGVITRMAVERVELAGHAIRPGTRVGVDLWSLSHDPSLFDAPDEFRPSRWLGRSGPPTQLEISQFGAGPHFCLGYHLAWLETVQLAVALAHEASRRGRRPRLREGRIPKPIFLPLEHPPPGTVVEIA